MNENKIDNTYKFDSRTALAKKLNISRQTLYNRLKSNGLSDKLSFTKAEYDSLKNRKKKIVKDYSKVDKEIDKSKDLLISTLREELTNRNNTINQLNEQLINSQKLQLLASQEKNQLLEELNQYKLIEQPRKASFWSRLFSKRN